MPRSTEDDLAGQAAARHAIIQSAGQFQDLTRRDLERALRVLDLLATAARDAAIPLRGTEFSAERAQGEWARTFEAQLSQSHDLVDLLALDWDRA